MLPGFMAPTENEAEVKRLFKRISLSSGARLAFHAKVKESGDRSREAVYAADLTASPSGAFLEPGADLLSGGLAAGSNAPRRRP